MKTLEYLKANAGTYLVPKITCTDGFEISVQASRFHYCSPREDGADWDEVECGYPSAKPEFIMDYAESKDNPCSTVYGYVPIELVDQLIESHGGIKP